MATITELGKDWVEINLGEDESSILAKFVYKRNGMTDDQLICRANCDYQQKMEEQLDDYVESWNL
jgi:hypothetical protein